MELLPSSILHKTALGLAAVKAHDRSLDQKSRTLLILMDGSKTVQELSKFSPDPVQIPLLLQSLLDMGLVAQATQAEEVVAPTSAAVPQSVVGAAGVLKAPLDLKGAARKASRALENILGPSSEVLCMQIEKCKTMDELVAKVQDLRVVVARLLSVKKADEFVASALGT